MAGRQEKRSPALRPPCSRHQSASLDMDDHPIWPHTIGAGYLPVFASLLAVPATPRYQGGMYYPVFRSVRTVGPLVIWTNRSVRGFSLGRRL